MSPSPRSPFRVCCVCTGNIEPAAQALLGGVRATLDDQRRDDQQRDSQGGST
ncbi:hypothetical protein ACH429_10260 [Streptomyces pathocidini]|uniref:Uncharacterized protein n=1 Tax=Streptomyces pathocidini TaxID=1650571 RepID=A0ABW7UPC8_9ACTN|nr:hypothetical protein [Streptomyces pathocidini]